MRNTLCGLQTVDTANAMEVLRRGTDTEAHDPPTRFLRDKWDEEFVGERKESERAKILAAWLPWISPLAGRSAPRCVTSWPQPTSMVVATLRLVYPVPLVGSPAYCGLLLRPIYPM
jgi:hypothetical protein